MSSWRSRGGKSQRRARLRRKKLQPRETVEKSPNLVFFQCLVAPEGRKVRSPKQRVRSGGAMSDETTKIARRCGRKQTSKSNCHTHTLAQKGLFELGCGMYQTCKNNPAHLTEVGECEFEAT